LLELESRPNDSEIINNIFRAAHSLKSSAAFVGLNDLSDLAHKMENLLQGIRDGTMSVTRPVVQALFKSFDVINAVISAVSSGNEPKVPMGGVIAELQRISESETDAKPAAPEKSATPSAKPVEAPTRPAAPDEDVPKLVLSADDMRAIRQGVDAGMLGYDVTVFIDPAAVMKWMKAQLVLNNIEKIGTVVRSIPDVEDLSEKQMPNVFKVIVLTDENLDAIRAACDVDLIYRVDLRDIAVSQVNGKTALTFREEQTLISEKKEEQKKPVDVAAEAEEEEVVRPEEDEAEAEIEIGEEKDEDEAAHPEAVQRAEGSKGAILKTVRVSIDKLDLLLNNVGELVIANSGFYRLYEDLRRRDMDKALVNEFKNRMEQMSRIAKDLQSGIMKTRMVPIGQVLTRFKRLVRDLAMEFDKKVNLKILGEETELDKKVIDSIGEPLMHLLRNAIDHGIETASERVAMRKAEVATITLNAYQGGNQIFVEVADDGRGLDIDSIKRKAMEKGLATAEMIASMDNEDIFNFIFAPGFSTAKVITDISGRGVGMNVVKEVVSELNGNVAIETEPGMGTRFVLSFPITLAIIPAIMVKVNREMYAIPLSDVIETIKVAESDITTIEGHEVINLRGEILSLLRLNEFVALDSALGGNTRIPVVVVGYGNRKVGLLVDYLEGKQEIVIKSLEQNYATVEGLAGASILGDGSICLILDIASMINKVINDQDFLMRRDRKKALDARIDEIKEVSAERIDLHGKTTAPKTDDGFSGGSREASAPAESARGDFKDYEPFSISAQRVTDAKSAEKPVDAQRPVMAGIAKGDEPVADLLTRVAAEPPRTAVDDDEDEEIKKRVQETLDGFRQDLKDTIKTAAESGTTDDHIMRSLGMTREDLSRVQVVSNVGAANAAESLSKVLGKRIDLTIPEVRVLPIEKIPEFVGRIDNVFIGVYMPLTGDIRGTVLFSFIEESGFELISLLYGKPVSDVKTIDEDGESALKEITNIVGSSVVNVFSEKINLAIKPTVPTVVHDFMQSILDSMLVLHNISNDYALLMETDFYYEDDKVIGNLLILPDTESLQVIVKKLRP